MAQDISKKDKKALSAFNDVHYDSPDSVEVDPSLKKEEEKEVSGNVEHYVAQYDNILEATDKLTKVIDLKCEGFTVTFDPDKDPGVASAIRKVFGIDAKEITYDMYKQVMDEQTELYQEMGDEIFGQ